MTDRELLELMGYSEPERCEIVGRWQDDRVMIVSFHAEPRGWGYDVIVGREDLQRMDTTNTEQSARWLASNYAPEARPAS